MPRRYSSPGGSHTLCIRLTGKNRDLLRTAAMLRIVALPVLRNRYKRLETIFSILAMDVAGGSLQLLVRACVRSTLLLVCKLFKLIKYSETGKHFGAIVATRRTWLG
jgi:hypothetical protein